MKKVLALVLFGLIAVLVSAQTPTPAPTPTPVVNPSGLNFTSSSEVTAFRYAGVMSAGAKITQSLDIMDWGAAKANHLSTVGYEFLEPTPGVSFYGGGVRVDPNLSAILSKTNISPSQFGVFAESAVGVAVLPKTTGVGVMLGGGIKYQITSSLGWNSLSVNYLRLGSTNGLSMSTGLSYIFK